MQGQRPCWVWAKPNRLKKYRYPKRGVSLDPKTERSSGPPPSLNFRESKKKTHTLLAKEQRYLPLEAEETLPAPEHGDVSGIVTLIRTLPPLYRQVLELKLLLEWTDREMARYLGLSEGQVRTRIWRGRKLLQAALRKEGYEYDQG